MPFLILRTFAFVCRPQRAQSTNDRNIESLDSTCLSISSALTRAVRTADCRFGHSLRWRVPSVKHQFNYGKSATGEREAVSLMRHAFTPSRLTEKSPIRRPSKSVDKSFFAANRVPETQSTFNPHARRNAFRRRDVRPQSRSFAPLESIAEDTAPTPTGSA